ncbi:hypothetical protein GCM10020295_37960 [Streptomyces cinereospinus]
MRRQVAGEADEILGADAPGAYRCVGLVLALLNAGLRHRPAAHIVGGGQHSADERLVTVRSVGRHWYGRLPEFGGPGQPRLYVFLEAVQPPPAAWSGAQSPAGRPSACGEHRGVQQESAVIGDRQREQRGIAVHPPVYVLLVPAEDRQQRVADVRQGETTSVDDVLPGIPGLQRKTPYGMTVLPGQSTVRRDLVDPLPRRHGRNLLGG